MIQEFRKAVLARCTFAASTLVRQGGATSPARLCKTPIAISEFAPRLIAWQRAHGRHHLPWQHTHDPYRIWLSEIMLQQTQVATVIPYYERFIARFPTLVTLAAASLDEVMALWSGLGYYSRARNLHRCAQTLIAQYGGQFPQAVDALAALPGIGRSTAAAIAVFAFGARATILDGNVKRVLARVYGIEGFPGGKAVERTLWQLAERLLPSTGPSQGRQSPPWGAANDSERGGCSFSPLGGRPGERQSDLSAYTQGLMDLGAMLCIRGVPGCAHCPFAIGCVANTTGRQRELPTARPKRAVPTRQTWMLVLRAGNTVLLEHRPPVGIWGGLWSLPQADDETALAARALQYGVVNNGLSELMPLIHTFTHFRLEIKLRIGVVDLACRAVAMDDDTAWVALPALDTYGVPAPVKRLLKALDSPLLHDVDDAVKPCC